MATDPMTTSLPPITGDEELSPLEADILEEYERLALQMRILASHLAALSNGPPTTEILDSLRLLERKTTLVFTALKASVYSIVLEQQVRSSES